MGGGLEFRILGPLEVTSDGQALDLGGSKQRALLAVLLLNVNEVVSQQRLIDALWEDDPPETAQKAVQVHVSALRKLVGRERLETRPPGYRLRVDAVELDLERFRALRAEGRAAEALTLWRGPPLADFAYQRFAQAEIARLEELRLGCIEERVEGDLLAGRHAELVGELEGLVAEHPLRERLRGQLMLALYRSGRQADALTVYQDARRVLVDELGIEPTRKLRDLHQAVLRQDPALEQVEPARAEATVRARDFVGREPELAQLLAGLDDVVAGHGRLFLLQGEPGIGKSALADQLASHASGRGAHVLVGRCWEAGGAPAYWPWTQSLRAYVRRAEAGIVRRQLGSNASDVAQIVPELHDLFPGLPAPVPAESEAARFRLFDATASFLHNVGSERPVAIVLDDLHAADEPSLLLLRYVASTLAESRVLIVGTFRDLDPAVRDPLESTLAELGREPLARRIQLGGLSQDEVGRLAELTAETMPSRQFVANLHAETDGNPLFVSEIVRLLAAEGRLGPERAAGMPIPETIREVIGRRLSRLSGECRRVLSLASVFGREFGLVALERVADYTGIDRLLGVLDEAIAARVVEEIPGAVGRLRFGHALTRDTLYEEIPATHRARLHRRVGEVLETLYAANPEPHLAELAHHFSMAVPATTPDKPVDYARRAGEHAAGVLAYEEAARLFVLALDALELSGSADQRMRCGLLLAVGDAHARAGDMTAAKAASFGAAEIAQRVGMPFELARAAITYGGRLLFERASSDDRLVPLIEAAIAALPDDAIEVRARLLARLGGALRDEHERDRRDSLSREAVDLARRSGDLSALAYALDGRASAVLAPDTLQECLALGAELLEVGGKIGDSERVGHAHIHRFIAHLSLGDVEQATLELDAASRVADELRQPAQLWQARGGGAMLALALGNLHEAERLVREAFVFGEQAQQPMASGVHLLQQYMLYDFRGRLEEVESEVRRAAPDHPARPVLRCVLAHLEARLGKRLEATRLLRELSGDGFGQLPFDMEWLYGMSMLAETAALVEDDDAAPFLYELLDPWASLNVVDMAEGMRGSVARYLGLLASTINHWDDAERHFEAALTTNERMGARPWLAHTEADYAAMLIARDARGDADRARQLIDRATATYRELEMASHAARASTLARS
jgi:DNA-binding SARP family transcriptional activator/tetratricopeptide (TPR) repeat protein